MIEIAKPLTRQQQWRKKNPLKYEAHKAVSRALNRGDLVKQPCEVCGCERVDAHHPDYRFPLLVQWLCRKCHIAAHKAEEVA